MNHTELAAPQSPATKEDLELAKAELELKMEQIKSELELKMERHTFELISRLSTMLIAAGLLQADRYYYSGN